MNEDELAAIFATLRAMNEAAETTTADMIRTAEANRTIPGKVLREAQQATQEITTALKAGTEAALIRIEQGAKEVAESRVNAVLKPALDRMERMEVSGNQAASLLERAARQVEWSQKALYAVVGALLGALIVTGAFWTRINRISDDVGMIVGQQTISQSVTSAASGVSKRGPASHGSKPKIRKENDPAAVTGQDTSQPQ